MLARGADQSDDIVDDLVDQPDVRRRLSTAAAIASRVGPALDAPVLGGSIAVVAAPWVAMIAAPPRSDG